MEPFPGYDVCGAQPKRQIRPPVRYETYEVDYPASLSQPLREAVEPRYQEDMTRTAPLTPSFSLYRPSTPSNRDVILQETDWWHRDVSRLHIQEKQTDPPPLADRELKGKWHGYSTPLTPALHYRHLQEDIKAELYDIRQERHLMQQSQKRMSEDLAELRALRAEMKQLVEAVRTLPCTASSRSHVPTQSQIIEGNRPEQDEDWPAPPPWPDPVEEVPPPRKLPVTHYQPRDKSMQDSPLWIKPVPAERLTAAYDDAKSDLECNSVPLEQHLRTAWTQPQFHTTPGGRNAMTSDVIYHGPRPKITNLATRDPSEFARLKISLENLLPANATELFKYQVLVDHLQLEEARLIADAYLNSPTPFTDTMVALSDKFGQPHQNVLKRIAVLMDSPDLRRGDVLAFERFALQIQSLVGMLRTLGREGEVELQCGSHVARLLSKLPPEQRAEFHRCMFH